MKSLFALGAITGALIAGCSSGNTGSTSGDTASKAPPAASKETPSKTPPTTSAKASKGLVGKWVVDQDEVKKRPGADPNYLMGFCSTFRYEFKGDKTFSGGITSGRYELKGNSLTVFTTKVGTTEMPSPSASLTGTLSQDGTKLTLKPTSESILPDYLHGGIPMKKDTGA